MMYGVSRLVFILLAILCGMYASASPTRQLIGARYSAMYENDAAPPAYWGLCFTAEEPNVVINMKKTGNVSAVTLETSFDGQEWIAFDADNQTTPVVLENRGDRVYFRAGDSGNTRFGAHTSSYRWFSISNGTCKASGNIMSLLNGSDWTKSRINTWCFIYLFRNCKLLKSPPELPAIALAQNAYYGMFSGCSILKSMPELPATTLAQGCYNEMFSDCSALTKTFTLPAKVVPDTAYAYMFRRCTSLVSGMEIMASNLQNRCCLSMFAGCTPLVKPATIPYMHIVGNAACSGMFSECTSLIHAPELPAKVISTQSYYCMFKNAYTLRQAPSILPATTLYKQCYEQMFYSCYQLTNAPTIVASTPTEKCCSGMFWHCHNVHSINVAFTTWESTDGFYNWLRNVSSTGIFYCPSALGTNDTIERGVNRCPAGWTVVNTD